ncbi:MAG: ATP-binding protein [Microbacteriaceae bacterium]
MSVRSALLGDALRTLGARRTAAGRRQMLTRTQLPFVILFSAALGTVLLISPVAARPLLLLPWTAVVVITALLYLVPWETRGEEVGLATALLDIAAIVLALIVVGDHAEALSLLEILPITVMSYAFGIAGLVAAMLSALAVAVIPPLARADEPLAGLGYVDLVLPAVTVSFLALGVHGASRLLGRMQRRLREAAVESENERVIALTVLDTLDVGTAFVRPDQSLAFTNTAFTDVVERSRVDPETRAGVLVFAADGVTPIGPGDQMMAQAARGEYFDSRLYRIGEPGEQRSLLVTARPVVRADGEALGNVFVSRDVTELTDAIRAREEFLAGVSHELRTPLTSIVGYLEVVQDSIDAEALGVARALEVMQRNANQLMRRIGDLLHVADATVTMRPRAVEVVQIVRQAIDAIRIRAANAGVDVDGELCDPFTATLDPSRLAQVLDNLLTNAVKYSDRGGHVRVRVEQDGARMLLTVADEGRGIPAAEQGRIFGRFYRAEAVRGGPVGGAGLGLSIVRQIVDAHGGTITVHSRVGEGSTFVVELPLDPGAVAGAV